jgi:dTDP-4-dehydrorhamnose reductase
MKALCTGSAGMLAEGIRKAFKEDEMIYTDKLQLDVSDNDNVIEYLTKLDGVPDYILHLAAETDLEWCEKDPAHCYYTNTIGTINMVHLAEILKCPIVYMSTAGVFLGEKNYYVEDDTPNPINHYGRSKYYGELAVRRYPKHYIFRMSWAMGGGPELDKKFVNKVIKLIRGGAKEIWGIKDIYGSPTYTHDVAATIRASLIDKVPFGTYHTAGIGRASRYDVAQAIVDILNLKVEVIPTTSAHFVKDFPCIRAQNEVLLATKHYPSKMREWRVSLEEYLRGYYI